MVVITNSRETNDAFVADQLKEIDPRAEGEIAYALIESLYPICRSITSNGIRRSLRLVRESIPLVLREVISDTPVFNWTVPDELEHPRRLCHERGRRSDGRLPEIKSSRAEL
jgi:aminopeptidase-like protein